MLVCMALRPFYFNEERLNFGLNPSQRFNLLTMIFINQLSNPRLTFTAN
jgi:hypothetical protein